MICTDNFCKFYEFFKFPLDELMKNETSFIYGENPSEVPIYAVVNTCSNVEDLNLKNGIILHSSSSLLNQHYCDEIFSHLSNRN